MEVIPAVLSFSLNVEISLTEDTMQFIDKIQRIQAKSNSKLSSLRAVFHNIGKGCVICQGRKATNCPPKI